jgi:hypothetical protein
MSNRFLLFGEKPFDMYARERFADISVGIDRMNDMEALMFKDDFDGLVKKTTDFYAFPHLEISFEDKVVDLVAKNDRTRSRYFAEYSLIVKGDPYFLGLSPFSSGYRPVDLTVELKENVLSFVIDTRYHQEELTPEVTSHVKKEYMRIKRFISDSQANLNNTIDFFNAELEKLVIRQLANKLRKAVRGEKIRQSLDFK